MLQDSKIDSSLQYEKWSQVPDNMSRTHSPILITFF